PIGARAGAWRVTEYGLETGRMSCPQFASSFDEQRRLSMAKTRRAQRLEELAAQIRVCVKCPLHESRTIAVPGDGQPTAKLMIIGEAPGKEEDLSGHPFVGASGKFLNSVLEGTGIERADFFVTNTVKCRPPKNRTPKTLEVNTCTSNYLFEQIELINPRLIMLLGGV